MILDKCMLVVEVTLFFDDCCVFSVDLSMIPVFSQLLVCWVCNVSLLLFLYFQLSWIMSYHIIYIHINAVEKSQQLTVSPDFVCVCVCVCVYVMPAVAISDTSQKMFSVIG